MTDQELKDALDGLFAYDIGATDSGIRDEMLRKKVIQEISKDSKRISRIVRDMWLSDEAIEKGYSLEDILEFIKWLNNDLQC